MFGRLKCAGTHKNNVKSIFGINDRNAIAEARSNMDMYNPNYCDPLMGYHVEEKDDWDYSYGHPYEIVPDPEPAFHKRESKPNKKKIAALKAKIKKGLML